MNAKSLEKLPTEVAFQPGKGYNQGMRTRTVEEVQVSLAVLAERVRRGEVDAAEFTFLMINLRQEAAVALVGREFTSTDTRRAGFLGRRTYR